MRYLGLGEDTGKTNSYVTRQSIFTVVLNPITLERGDKHRRALRTLYLGEDTEKKNRYVTL